MTGTRDALYRVTRDFMARDYAQDVVDLNELIRKNRADSANLTAEVPPIPFTGDPWKKKKGDCVLFIGINPKFQTKVPPMNHPEFGPAISMINRFHRGDENSFVQYIDSRKNYFSSDEKYGTHFTAPEKGFRDNWYSVENPWDCHVQSMDCLPWFSIDAKTIDIDRVADWYLENSAMIQYHEIIMNVIDLIEPNWIHLNGKMPQTVFESNFAEHHFEKLEGINPQKGIRVGHCEIGNWELPVLSHNFAGWPMAPNGAADWRLMAKLWDNWLRLQE
uniref:Uncharacterized protein n=1 Tax=uncultured marine group II/III euryarchaeote SAT1000_50_G04 TaxID=1456586 RepID=A0A075IEK2_9EURY|nr:hypothetical protein [uncultured marine group II/III euryarchaeote SAT1000_50_G04]